MLPWLSPVALRTVSFIVGDHLGGISLDLLRFLNLLLVKQSGRFPSLLGTRELRFKLVTGSQRGKTVITVRSIKRQCLLEIVDLVLTWYFQAISDVPAILEHLPLEVREPLNLVPGADPYGRKKDPDQRFS
jgi:hypothetical protein